MKQLKSFIDECNYLNREDFLSVYPHPFLVTSLKQIQENSAECEKPSSLNEPIKGFSTTTIDKGNMDVVKLWMSAGWVFPVTKPTPSPQQMVHIGRTPNNDIVLPLPFVSKFHCCIFLLNNEAYLLDGGSTNGTYLNGTRVADDGKKRPLKDEDTLSFGQSLAFDFLEGTTLYDRLPRYSCGLEAQQSERRI